MSDSPQHPSLKQSPLLFWPRFGSWGSLRSLQLGRVLAKSSLKCSASVGGFLWLWVALNPGKFLSILQIILTLSPTWHTSKETCQRSSKKSSRRVQSPSPSCLAAFISSSELIFSPVFQAFLWSCYLDLKHSGIAIIPHFCLEDN